MWTRFAEKIGKVDKKIDENVTKPNRSELTSPPDLFLSEIRSVRAQLLNYWVCHVKLKVANWLTAVCFLLTKSVNWKNIKIWDRELIRIQSCQWFVFPHWIPHIKEVKTFIKFASKLEWIFIDSQKTRSSKYSGSRQEHEGMKVLTPFETDYPFSSIWFFLGKLCLKLF